MGVDKQGTEKPLEFKFQLGIPGKEKLVDILSQALSTLKIVQVIRYATQNHVTFCQIVMRHSDILGLKELLTLAQCKWRQLHLPSQAVIQPSFTVNQIVKHPRRGTAADYQHHLVMPGSP